VKNLEKFLKDYSADQQTESIVFQDCGGKSRLFPAAEGSDQCLCVRSIREGEQWWSLSLAVPFIVTKGMLVNWQALVSVIWLLIK